MAPTLAELRADFGSDILAELIGTYLRDSSDIVRSLDAAITAGDLASVASLAHGLKGSAGNFGASYVVRLASELEQSAKSGAGAGVLRDAFEALRVEAQAVRLALLRESDSRTP